jgi:hypothetical protein
MKVQFSGSPRGLHHLVSDLRAEGVEVTYQPPEESRGAGDVAVTVTLWVAAGAAAKAGEMTLEAIVRRVVAAYRKRFPGGAAEVTDDAA